MLTNAKPTIPTEENYNTNNSDKIRNVILNIFFMMSTNDHSQFWKCPL